MESLSIMDNAAAVGAALLGLVGLAAAATRKASAPSSPSSPSGPSSAQIDRLGQAFAAAGVTDFSPEEFLLLRKWGQIAEMPEEYEPNLVALAVQAQALRDRLGLPVAVRNGYRSPAYNAAVSGAPNSAHLRGAAGDFEVPSAYGTAENDRRIQVEGAKLWLLRPGALAGLGVYQGGRVHLDVFHPGGQGRRSWGSGDLAGVLSEAQGELGQA